MDNIMNLRLFDDPSYTVTLYSDAGFSAASASPASGAKNTKVTLTLTLASGYELDEVEVIAGGVTIDEDNTFKIGEANVVLNAKSKANNKYKIVENTYVNINGTKTELQRNMTLEKGANGAIVAVSCTGTAITLSSEIVASLVASGAIIKI